MRNGAMRPATLKRLAGLNVVVHVAALFLALVAVRPGSPLVPLADRLAYLGQQPLGWMCGWGAWMLCAAALIAFCAVLAHRLPAASETARLAVVLAVAGGAVDLLCDVVNITIVPRLAARTGADEALFLTMERLAGVGGLIVANGMYAVAILLLTGALRQARGPLRAITALGCADFVSGLVLASAGFMETPWLAELATGPTIGLYCAWIVAVAWHLEGACKDS
jgi:hypothetical protein